VSEHRRTWWRHVYQLQRQWTVCLRLHVTSARRWVICVSHRHNVTHRQTTQLAIGEHSIWVICVSHRHNVTHRQTTASQRWTQHLSHLCESSSQRDSSSDHTASQRWTQHLLYTARKCVDTLTCTANHGTMQQAIHLPGGPVHGARNWRHLPRGLGIALTTKMKLSIRGTKTCTPQKKRKRVDSTGP